MVGNQQCYKRMLQINLLTGQIQLEKQWGRELSIVRTDDCDDDVDYDNDNDDDTIQRSIVEIYILIGRNCANL